MIERFESTYQIEGPWTEGLFVHDSRRTEPLDRATLLPSVHPYVLFFQVIHAPTQEAQIEQWRNHDGFTHCGYKCNCE